MFVEYLRRDASHDVGAAICATAFAVLTILAPSSARADVRIHGATTPMYGLLKPQKAKIEQLAGVKITILPSSTLNGMADLVHGRADIAMLSEPLEEAIVSLNSKESASINSEEYVGRHVGNAYVQFIVHPTNPIKKLTNAQLAALLSGKIKNWSELGGSNQPVLVVGQPTSAAYRMIEEALRIVYPPDARIVQNTNQTAIIVAQAPGAMSNISTAHDLPERSQFKIVETDLKLQLRLYLAFRKDASDEIRRVVDAAASIGAP